MTCAHGIDARMIFRARLLRISWLERDDQGLLSLLGKANANAQVGSTIRTAHTLME